MKTWFWASLLAGAAATAQTVPPAPVLRDPMQPPAPRRSAPAPAGAAEAASAPAPTVRHLYAVGEQRWVVQGGRRYGVGDLLGGARIERIDDSAVFVRQGGSVLRLPLFAGVTKQPAGSAGAPPAAASAAVASTRTALAAPGGADRPPR